jgi:hypothetical protein
MIFHAATLILFILQVTSVITISWWLVFAPSIFAFGMFLFMMLMAVWAVNK